MYNLPLSLSLSLSVRHSLPWGGVAPGEYGLMFIAYTNNTFVLDFMLKAMVGQGTPYKPEGPVDGLFRFTRPISGCFFYTPSLEVLDAMMDYPKPSIAPSPSVSSSSASSPFSSSSSLSLALASAVLQFLAFAESHALQLCLALPFLFLASCSML